MKRLCVAAAAASLVLGAAPALAQDQAAAPAATPAEVAPPPAVTGAIAAPVYDLPDPATLTRPKLDYAATPEIVADYDKYFYFHRDGTSYVDAFNDVRECDALASGSNIYMGGNDAAMGAAMAQYGVLAGGIGGALGGLMADAIFGSAARRQQRRINLRNCMGFKGYQRYGLSGDLWKTFNFEEGNGRKKEGERNEALELQALVASGPKPAAKELGL
ncbi:hypothetical protein ACFFF7_03545 [Novosphingobium aquiterrae]|uniref:Uncharacterized protein n=1 Tax=Novosphingobium aquiterrae TaxID=624388 RepID=A0ABV6PF95_9SPHN